MAWHTLLAVEGDCCLVGGRRSRVSTSTRPKSSSIRLFYYFLEPLTFSMFFFLFLFLLLTLLFTSVCVPFPPSLLSTTLLSSYFSQISFDSNIFTNLSSLTSIPFFASDFYPFSFLYIKTFRFSSCMVDLFIHGDDFLKPICLFLSSTHPLFIDNLGFPFYRIYRIILGFITYSSTQEWGNWTVLKNKTASAIPLMVYLYLSTWGLWKNILSSLHQLRQIQQDAYIDLTTPLRLRKLSWRSIFLLYVSIRVLCLP